MAKTSTREKIAEDQFAKISTCENLYTKKYTDADLKISAYLRVHLKTTTLKFSHSLH